MFEGGLLTKEILQNRARALVALCAVIFICVAIGLSYLYLEPVELLDRWIRANPRSAPLIFIMAKMATILFPPTPGAALGLAGIRFFGWQRAFLYDYIGNMSGAILVFFFARRFRPALTRHFIFVQRINKWTDERLSNKLGFRNFFVIRLFTEGIFDFLSYAAGLTRIPFSSYFFATALGCIPAKFLVFYLGGVAIRTSQYVTVIFVVFLIIGAVWLQKTKAYDRVIGTMQPNQGKDQAG